MAPTLDDCRWLISEAAEPWLAIAREEFSPGGVGLGLLSRLRKDLPAERAHLIVEQIELRQRAREKFSRAERMFYTRKGLEQATDEQLASYKAARFPTGDLIADLCCGIGGDLVALAERGPTGGIDRDPVMALLAGANAQANGLRAGQCCVLEEDALHVPLAGGAWHCDPDRRAEGRRTTRGELFEPPLAAIDSLLGRNLNAAIKLAPATEAPANWQESAEREWLGSRGECRQQVAWFGKLARFPGRRTATVVDARGGPRTVVGNGEEAVPVAVSLGRYFYEPHAAVLGAKLTTSLSREHELTAVSTGIAYLTSDRLIADPALAAFEVVAVLPLDRKQLKAYCREHNIGRLEVKKRGVPIDPERLRKEVIASGDCEATLIVTPAKGAVRALVTRRIGREE